MRIALSTIGSRGDIQPYIALGTELQKDGHQVAILTHPWAEQIIQAYGLHHIPIGDDIDVNYCAKQFVENSSNNIKGFRFALNFIFDNLRQCHKDFLSAFNDFDLIVGHGIVGKAEADILEKPFITISIETMGLQKEYWKSKNIFKELGVYLSESLLSALFGKPYLRFRKEIGAPVLGKTHNYPYLALIPMPLFLQKPNTNWKDKTEISGYLFAETPKEYCPSNELLDFINNGEKPILVTFGSMFHTQKQTKYLYEIVCESLVKSNARAILIMPDLNEQEVEVPNNVFVAKQVPYSWLLRYVEIVVHHFGFGTTAEVLKSGLPSVPIPHIFDQKIRATTVHKLGYSHKSLNINKINSDILSAAIVRVKNNSFMKDKCVEASIAISKQNGARKAVEHINAYIKQVARCQ